MNDCPLVRSLGKIVEDDGKPFVWIPGELPFFGMSKDYVQVVADKNQVIHANRVEDGVPIFSEAVNVSHHTYALAAGDIDALAESRDLPPPAVALHDADGDHSSDANVEGEEPTDCMRRLVAEANSIEHKLLHFQKNPACSICSRSRMYRKKVRRFRPNPWKDRGGTRTHNSFWTTNCN